MILKSLARASGLPQQSCPYSLRCVCADLSPAWLRGSRNTPSCICPSVLWMQLLSAIHDLMDISTLKRFFLHYLAVRIPASVALRDLPPPCYETAGSPGAGHIYFGRKWAQAKYQDRTGDLQITLFSHGSQSWPPVVHCQRLHECSACI